MDMLLTPFDKNCCLTGVAVAAGSKPPGGRKLTLIFFSCTSDLLTDSHYSRCVSACIRASADDVSFRRTYDSLNVVELLVTRNDDRLNEEFIAALRIHWRILLHCLQQDCREGPFSIANRAWISSSTGNQPVTSTSRPGSMRPEFGRTQYL